MENQKKEDFNNFDYCQSSMCDDLVKELIQSGVDLKNYSQDVNKQLKKVENACVGDYISESSNIARLHQQINESDQILEKIEGMLCAFQADLGNICQEILTLQEQSVNLNIKLKNKLEVRNELSQFIDDIVVPQTVISTILDCAPHEKKFLNQLQVLNQKICFVKDQCSNDSKSCKDVMDILDNLKIKAIIKINDYIMKKIQLFRKPMSNYQVLQTAILQKSFFFYFLVKHNREVAKAIHYEYIDTLSKVYCSYFKEYLSRLDKLKFEELADKDDLMAADDSSKSRANFFTGKHVVKKKSTVFTLGNRAAVIKEELESDIIVPHLAQKNETKFTLESIFRSIQYAIVEHACREHFFISNFFSKKNQIVQEIFTNIFQKTIQLVLKQVEDEFTTSYDCIGLFLCLHLIYRFRLICHKRAVPALNEYWESLINILWVRFEYLIQLQIQSVKNCDINKIGNCDTRPHYITRRYAEFSAAIITINDTFPDERVSIYLGSLYTEIENLIFKLASKFNTPKEQLIFLINNSDMILSVLMEKKKEESRESENIKQQINKRIQDFVEEMLYPNFGQMISFVKDCESYLEKNNQDALLKESEKILPIIKNFNNGWKEAIEGINKEILKNFTNFNCGNEIKMSTLMKMVQYYHKFHQIVSSDPFKNNPARSLLMNIHQLMLEIKKYKIN